MADNLVIFGHTYNSVEGFKATDTNNNEITYTPGESAVLETLQVSYTPSETAINDTQTPSQGYDGFDEAQISVAAIPSSYVGSGVTRQAAQTIHPSTSDQSIATGQYLTGAQTIKAVLLTNLLAENIKSGVTVKVGDSTDDDCVASILGTYTGGVTAATGEITLSSDFSLSTSAQNIPGLQLSFQPDFFYIIRTHSSWNSSTPTSAGLHGLIAVKKSLVAPYRISSNVSTDSVTGDYLYVLNTNVTADTSAAGGYALNGFGMLGTSYYSRYSVNSNGTISVGRFSSASTKMVAGTYRYFAIKI